MAVSLNEGGESINKAIIAKYYYRLWILSVRW
jgi:hypothetical protein